MKAEWELINLKKELNNIESNAQNISVYPGIYWRSINLNQCLLIKIIVEQVGFNKVRQTIKLFEVDNNLLNKYSIFLRSADSLQNRILNDIISKKPINQTEFNVIEYIGSDEKDDGGKFSVRVGVMCSLQDGTTVCAGVIKALTNNKKNKKKVKKSKSTYINNNPIGGNPNGPVIPMQQSLIM